MFDFDVGKLIIVGVVALLVIGPKDLPRVMRQIGQWTGKLRRMAGEFRGQFMDAMREADLDSIKKEVTSVADSAKIHTAFDPIGDIKREVTTAVGPDPFALKQVETSMSAATDPAVAGGGAIAAAPAVAESSTTIPTVDLPPLELPAPAAGLAASAPEMVDAMADLPSSSSSRPKVVRTSRADSIAEAARRRSSAVAAEAIRRRPASPPDAAASKREG